MYLNKNYNNLCLKYFYTDYNFFICNMLFKIDQADNYFNVL